MRLYLNLSEALSEIQRDLAKGPKVLSSRVQQRTHEELPGRELLGYSYTIEKGGIPWLADEIVEVGKAMKFPLWLDNSRRMRDWMESEWTTRREGELAIAQDYRHPALKTAYEGNWPSYTYGERLNGSINAMTTALMNTPDSRRAFWPIFEKHDALRSAAPTRVPCSLGYQAIIRNTQDGPQLVLIYMQRSADFDAFFLSDIWFANRFQHELADQLSVPAGQFIHFVSSLHSFTVEGTEIY